MESTESFRTTAFSLPTKNTPPVYSEVECDQAGLFQVNFLNSTLSCIYINRPNAKTAPCPASSQWLTVNLLPFQRVVFPVEASLNRLLWNRSISPNSLLETSISEEVRPRDLEEEEATQTLGPLLPPTTTSRRHTLAEVSARFHQCNPPC